MKNILKDLFLRNWGIKLISFILALLLWLTFIPEEKIFSEKTLTIPLELHNTPDRMEIMENPQSTIEVKIRASRKQIGQITASNVGAVLDLRNATISQQNYPLSIEMIEVPEGVEVKEVSPNQIMLKLEAIKEVNLKIKVDFTGKMPEGYKITQYEILPPSIPVKGPESKFKEGYTLKTFPINQSNLTESKDIDTELILPSPDLSWATSKNKATIKIQVQKEEEKNDTG